MKATIKACLLGFENIGALCFDFPAAFRLCCWVKKTLIKAWSHQHLKPCEFTVKSVLSIGKTTRSGFALPLSSSLGNLGH